ncbi:helix-turn-helix domain-containing protein [Nocardia sp. NPDC056000]|uniref:helix-turn-helix domain-containing protein n=1 Tax=Nocardia sp. NPDC056000 TaxID=3345674 RepID=UPI0035DFFC6F
MTWWMMPRFSLYFGMTFGQVLRQLRRTAGLNQHDLAVFIDREHTYISKLEGGKVHCAPDDVTLLADAVKADADDRAALYQSYENETGRSVLGIDGDEVSRNIDALVRSTQTLRLLGDPRLAYELATTQFDPIMRVLRSGQALTSRGSPIFPLVCELVLEQTKSALDFMTRPQVVNGSLNRGLGIQRQLSDLTADSTATVAAHLSCEAVLYASGDIHRAHEVGLELIQDFPDYSPIWASEVLRSVAINAGLIGDARALNVARQRFSTSRGLFTAEQASFILEGLARGGVHINPARARADIDEARDLYQRVSLVPPIRMVQLARAQALSDLSSDRRSISDASRIELEQALATSRAKRYLKYDKEIERFLLM